jgi:hypothetical protein
VTRLGVFCPLGDISPMGSIDCLLWAVFLQVPRSQIFRPCMYLFTENI